MLEEQIQMVDLHGQYLRFKEEINGAMQAVTDSCAFINGPQVKTFAGHLADYLQVPYVIPCANGTDALQIALMALELQPGDEVIRNGQRRSWPSTCSDKPAIWSRS